MFSTHKTDRFKQSPIPHLTDNLLIEFIIVVDIPYSIMIPDIVLVVAERSTEPVF